MKRTERHTLEPLLEADAQGLPSGPPLSLERPGRATELLRPFVLPERLERLRTVIANRTRRLTLLLEEVHDAHNISACIRTCEAFGLLELHLIPAASKPLKVSRLVASGADRWLTVHIHDDLDGARRALKERGYRLAVTDPREGPGLHTPSDIPIDAPLCIAFGNEKEGVSARLLAAADLRLHIPMSGFVESLNISVAVAISVARIRERFEQMPAASWRLEGDQQAALLDRWILEDVPHARTILEEIAKRQQSALYREDGSV
jgi:tRNA (guanosine-2'-O-)-methyltransferase